MRNYTPRSTLPFTQFRCPHCSTRHRIGAFAVGEYVRYVANRSARKGHISVGSRGRVVCYVVQPGGAQRVHVQFARRKSTPLVLELFPCELESIDACVQIVVAQ